MILLKTFRLLLVISILLISFISPCFAQLSVSENLRYLIDQNGKPFFWLGDTGWGLFQKLDREEVDFYLKTRARQGFTTIHAAAVHKNPFITPELENSYGDKAFLNEEEMIPAITPRNDLSDPIAYDYWDHVDFVIDRAEKYGIQIVFLPLFNMTEGEGYNLINEKNALDYGLFLGKRYKSKTNIIWCIGGDVLADNELKKSIWNLLAKGINLGVAGNEDYSQTLMTFHTRGGHTSSEYFRDAPWIDFHMLQTWDLYVSIYDVVSKDYHKMPTAPILHGEGAYEDGPEYPTKPITSHKIRKQAYWATFAGGLHTYGNSNVWSFGSNQKYATEDWKEAVFSKGAQDMSQYSKLMQELEWWNFAPRQSLIIEGINEKESLNTAQISSDSREILIYISEKMDLKVDLTPLLGEKIKAYWINPQTGKKLKASFILDQNQADFNSPKEWQDAILWIVGQ